MRTFIAVRPDINTIRSITEVISVLRDNFKDVRWVKPENLHITVKFLGDTSQVRLDHIKKNFSLGLSVKKNFRLKTEDISLFKRNKKVSVINCRVWDTDKALSALYSYSESFFSNIGFKREERIYTPHITIGRNKKYFNTDLFNRVKHNINDKTISEFSVNAVSLYSSTLTANGAEYKIIKEFHLD